MQEANPFSVDGESEFGDDEMSMSSSKSSMMDIDAKLKAMRAARGLSDAEEPVDIAFEKDYVREQRMDKENKLRDRDIERKLREIRMSNVDLLTNQATAPLPREVLAELLQEGHRELRMPILVQESDDES